MAAPFNPYKHTQVTTASPETILIMLYDGAISYSRTALDKIDQGDIPGRGVYIGKALAIVLELINTLNHEVGGEISQRLEQLYRYMIDEFTRANLQGTAKPLEDALKVLLILRDAWTEAVKIKQDERAAEHVAAGKMLAAG